MTSTYRALHRFAAFAFAVVGASTLSACTEDEKPAGEDFISDDPNAGFDSGYEGGADDGGATGGDEGGDEGGDDDAGADVLEADIIQLEGDRLYALSAYSGLTVVDMQNPDKLRALGSWETDADPFEMYVEAGQAFVMFNDYGFWEWDDDFGEWTYATSSRLVALDASDPTDIAVKGEFTLPGRIQDSRRVGDVLYLVTMENGWCWSCDGTQKTVVTSLDISDRANPHVVDQLTFTPENKNWDWQRSVESTNQRMYIASRSWTWQEGMGSVIDVVDISAGTGELTLGERVAVQGSVFSRWQMNEHEGVLRVVSQRGWLDPMIETFQVISAQELTPLGQGTLTLPSPERLRSVRYDGDRAYAITAVENEDPLFTIDFSDPSNPQQMGELEIPGWVYHMEPRGDRVLALGFDPEHPDGSLNVSLFDVSDFAAPTLRRRVHFGGSWAGFAEDQNRIHKAFTILPDEQMLLVPHTGWDYGDNFGCPGRYRSGVQIIDWLADDLTLRGVVPSHGRVRRAFTHAQRIVTVSDTELATFAYADRDAPQARDSLALAVHVDELVRAGDLWVRLARNWWTEEQLLEVVDLADPASPEPLGVIDLAIEGDCQWSWIDGVYAKGEHVFVVQSVIEESSGGNGDNYRHFSRVIAVDVSDPSAPVIEDSFEVPGERSWGVAWVAGVATQASTIAHHGDHLVLLTEDPDQDYKNLVQVLDLADPSNIKIAATLARPAGQTQGALSVMSDRIVSWHTEPVEGQPGKVRFYFDRLVLDSGQPHWAAKINVPGIIVAYDAAAGRAFTIDFRIHKVDLTPQECWQHPKFWHNDWIDESCYLIDYELEHLAISGSSATLLETIDIAGDHGLHELHASGSRIFAKLAKVHLGDYDTQLLTIDISGDKASVHAHDGEQLGSWWSFRKVDGERAVLMANSSELVLVDASDAEQLDFLHSSMPGWGRCWSPVIEGDQVHCPMGPYGVETVEW